MIYFRVCSDRSIFFKFQFGISPIFSGTIFRELPDARPLDCYASQYHMSQSPDLSNAVLSFTNRNSVNVGFSNSFSQQLETVLDFHRPKV